jgi:hypothetical protein
MVNQPFFRPRMLRRTTASGRPRRSSGRRLLKRSPWTPRKTSRCRRPSSRNWPPVSTGSRSGTCLATLGSLASDSPYKLLVTLNNRGAAIERIELNQRTSQGRFRYRDSDRRSGYLGHLQWEDAPGGGCRIQVVGPGTPAATARSLDPAIAPGAPEGDTILQMDDRPIRSALDWQRVSGGAAARPGSAHRGVSDGRGWADRARRFRGDADRRTVERGSARIEPSRARPAVPDPLSFLFT